MSFHYIFGDYDDRIELEIVRDTARTASYLDIHLEINSKYRLRTIKGVIL